MGRKTIDDAMKEIEARCEKVMISVIEELRYETENLFYDAVNEFYADYKPRRYSRTYSTFLAADFVDWAMPGRKTPQQIWYDEIPDNSTGRIRAKVGRGKGKIEKVKDGVYQTTICIDPSFIPGEPYRARKGKEWVFDRTWNQGIHGVTKYKPSEESTGRGKYSREMTPFAKKPREYGVKVPRKMKRSPDELMRGWFNSRINNQKKFNETLVRAIIREFYS